MTATHMHPERLAQAMGALESANKVRTGRAQLKMQLKRKQVTLDDLLLGNVESPWFDDMQIKDLLVSVPGIGEKKAKRLLVMMRASSYTLAGSLSFERRMSLVSYVRGLSYRQ